ncbi:helix-turn-helix domain-containing protein [Albimonas sp. CAU 1670]|uniref:winged helix-turn-helix transcriptional regulator n=1 Tax=Albimonas sp. CAU 1670 TaxID=3032599 RepID=UPI0023D9C327|nr:helix-turn-helix domain-containing protein [Albimonas sp. CAU 1670]MDF2231685.1 helix-turn-helix domain-containing protein [Albimonas sp. CAU 1670]
MTAPDDGSPEPASPGVGALEAATGAAPADPAAAFPAGGGAPIVFDAFRRDCASHAVLRILANKWVVLVVSALAMGSMRHSELARKVEGATPKMLTQALRELERDGLVARHVEPASPPRVSYALTPLGRDLAVPLRRLCRWSEAHAARILVSRAKADGAVLSAESWRRIAGIK